MAKFNQCECGRNKYYRARYCKQCKIDNAASFCKLCEEPILKVDRFGKPYPYCYNCREVPNDIKESLKSVLDEEQANNAVFIEPSLFDEDTLQRVLNAAPAPSASRQRQQSHGDIEAPGDVPVGTCSYCTRDLYASDLADLCKWCIAGQPDVNDHEPIIKPKVRAYKPKPQQAVKRKRKKPLRKLAVDDVPAVRRLHAAGGVSYAQLGKRFGVSKSTIKNAVKRKTFAHIS